MDILVSLSVCVCVGQSLCCFEGSSYLSCYLITLLATITVSWSDHADCRHLEEELKLSKAEILGLRAALSSCNEEINLLKLQTEELQHKFEKESEIKDAQIHQQGSEVEEKSNTIAHLTQQLHQTQLRLKATVEDSGAQDTVCTCGIVRMPNRRRRVRRTTSSPTPQDISSLTDDYQPRQHTPFTPKPPSSPRPPSSSSSSPHIANTHPLTCRARSSARRQSFSPETVSTEAHVPRPPSTSTSSLPTMRLSTTDPRSTLEPVYTQKHSEIPPDISEILLHQEKGDIQVVARPPPSVLPPIRSETVMPSPPFMSSACSTESKSFSEPSSRLQYRHRHRRIFLAESQGLSSAPSTMRVLHYNTRGTKRGEGGGPDPSEAAEGTLLVKEAVNRKDPAWWELHQHRAD